MVSTEDIKIAARSHFKNDVIANEPLVTTNGTSLDGMDTSKYDGLEEYSDIKLPLGRRPFMRTLLMIAEIFFVSFVVMLPSLFLKLFIPYEKYNIITYKVGMTGFTPNDFQEFFRWSVFVAASYSAYIFACWAVGMASSLILGGARVFKLTVSEEVRRSLKLIKRIQTNLAWLTWFCLELFIGGLILYSPAFMQSATGTGQIRSNSFLTRESTERFLIAAAFVTALFSLEKYLIQVVTFHFHKESLSARINANNERRQMVGYLYRAIKHGSTSQTPALRSEFADVGLHELHYDKLLKDREAEVIANDIFKALKPKDRDFIRPENFKQFMLEHEAKHAFTLFDGELRGKIDADYFKATITEIYAERDRLMVAIVDNGRVVRRFDNALMTVLALVSIIAILSIFNEKGYTLVVGLFSILLTFAFLVKDTMSRISDAFRLIYIQRSFDVGDVIKVDGVGYTVLQIKLLTSVFLRNSDKVVVYVPNHVLSGKTIINTKRLPLTLDKAQLTIQGSIPMNQVGTFKSKLNDFMADTFPEYSGSCSLKIKEIGERDVQMALDLSFQPCTDEKVLDRRNKFKAKVVELLQELQIAANEPQF